MLNKKLLFIVILLVGVFGLFVNINIAQAGPCRDAGGSDCYVACPSNMQEYPDGNVGCIDPNIRGKKCCGPKSEETTSGIIPDGGKMKTGDYALNDIIQVVVNVSNWILGIVGSLALLMFIYGGVMFLVSAGSSEKVTQAKQILVNAVIGLVIVFTAYMIIQFAMQALGVTSDSWFKTGWF